jgi:ferredoxin
MEPKQRPSACIECGICAGICPQKIDIPGLLAKFNIFLRQELEHKQQYDEELSVSGEKKKWLRNSFIKVCAAMLLIALAMLALCGASAALTSG